MLIITYEMYVWDINMQLTAYLSSGWGKIGHGWRTTVNGRRKAKDEEGTREAR